MDTKEAVALIAEKGSDYRSQMTTRAVQMDEPGELVVDDVHISWVAGDYLVAGLMDDAHVIRREAFEGTWARK